MFLPAFPSLRFRGQKVHNAQEISETRNVDVTLLVGEIDEESLKEELETCKLFFVESEMGNGGHGVLSFAMEIMDAHTLSKTLHTFFENLKCATELIAAFDFVLRSAEN